MKHLITSATIILANLVDFALAKPQSNHSTEPPISKRHQEALPLLLESRQRPITPVEGSSSWSSPPNIQWIDDPPVGANTHLLPVLYLMAPLVVTAMLMPIGATMIAAIMMLKANNSSNVPGQWTYPGRFKTLLFPRDEEVAPIFKILEQNFLDLLKRLDDAISKYNSDL